MNPLVYADAAYMVHIPALLSRSGMIIFMCGGCIIAKSQRQKLVTASSTEAELVAMAEATKYALALRHFLQAQSHELKPVVIYQDNRSVLDMLAAGRPLHARSKHIHMRYFSAVQHIISKEITVVWCPTEEMCADVLTKALDTSLYIVMRDWMLNR
jgi:hypothetical protein